MESGFIGLWLTLSLLWFLVYWILGGVFFALMTILRLGRVRKVRFSCLFTILSAACGLGVAFGGLRFSAAGVNDCLVKSENKIETVVAIFGCGFLGILGAFLIGAAVLISVGFLLMIISKSKNKPWIKLNHDEQEETVLPTNDGFWEEDGK